MPLNLVTPVGSPFEPERAIVDRELEALLGDTGRGVVREAMRHAVLGGGQRIRPVLALRVASLLSAQGRDASVAATAVEMIHCASLIIDDLPCMDDSRTRRGHPCTHVVYGEATAILAAFALVSLAAQSVAHLPRFQKRLLAVLDCNSLIGGQSQNLTDLKTVPLFELAVQAGGAASPRFAERELALMRFAREFGLAFQLADDVADGDLVDQAPALRQLEAARAIAVAAGSELLVFVEYLYGRIEQAGRRNR